MKRSVLLLASGSSLLVSSLLVGCMWDRFDELRENAPIETLRTPSDLREGLGTALAVAHLEKRVIAVAYGRPGTQPGVQYELGYEENPIPDVIDTTYCQNESDQQGRRCLTLHQPAALAKSWTPQQRVESRELCFVSGIGVSNQRMGLWARCNEQKELVFLLPEDIEKYVKDPFDRGRPLPPLYLASDPTESPFLLAGAPEKSRAWYYAPLQGKAIDLKPLAPAGKSFGKSLAVLPEEGGAALLAVGAPEAGQVWLFRAEGENVTSLGCWEGESQWGRSLAVGDVDGDGKQDLVVADAKQVRVLSGAVLAASSEEEEGSACQTLSQESLVLSSLRCATNAWTEECGKSGFGQALAVGDLDGDGRDEVAVGAPYMTADGFEKAGAVLVYDHTGKLRDTVILSGSAEGAEFGASLVAVPQKKRKVLLVGAPGIDKVNLVYCAGAAGTSISARCE